GDRRIDPSREQTYSAAAGAHRQPPGPIELAHVHVRVAVVQLDAKLQVRAREVYRQLGPSLERRADLPLQILRGQRERLVATAHADRERLGTKTVESRHGRLGHRPDITLARHADGGGGEPENALEP